MSLLSAAIVSLSQDMDLASDAIQNFMVVRLPTGQIIRARIDEEAANEILRLSVNGAAPTGAHGEAPIVFGDDEGPLSESLELVPPTAPPAPRKRAPIEESYRMAVDQDEDGASQI